MYSVLLIIHHLFFKDLELEADFLKKKMLNISANSIFYFEVEKALECLQFEKKKIIVKKNVVNVTHVLCNFYTS